jgi:hypothetical protein
MPGTLIDDGGNGARGGLAERRRPRGSTRGFHCAPSKTQVSEK